eukprot:8043664-Pyramimonas_sp.AAC.1
MLASEAAATSLQPELFSAIARAALGARSAPSTVSSSMGPLGGKASRESFQSTGGALPIAVARATSSTAPTAAGRHRQA